MKLTLVEPCGTKTEAGTETAELSLARATEKPPPWAGADRLTIQLSLAVPVSELLLQLNPLKAVILPAGGFSKSLYFFTTLPAEAVSVTDWGELTLAIWAVKAVLVCPGATVTEAGTETAGLSLVNETLSPLLLGAAERLTLQLSVVPPATVELPQAKFLSKIAAAPGDERLSCSPQPAMKNNEQQSVTISHPSGAFRRLRSLVLCLPVWGIAPRRVFGNDSTAPQIVQAPKGREIR